MIDNFTTLDSMYGKFLVNKTSLFCAPTAKLAQSALKVSAPEA